MSILWASYWILWTGKGALSKPVSIAREFVMSKEAKHRITTYCKTNIAYSYSCGLQTGVFPNFALFEMISDNAALNLEGPKISFSRELGSGMPHVYI